MDLLAPAVSECPPYRLQDIWISLRLGNSCEQHIVQFASSSCAQNSVHGPLRQREACAVEEINGS